MRDEPEVLEAAALDRLLRVGGQDFVIEMIDLFLLHAPERIAAAIAAAAAGDLVTVHRSAHSLKSTAANIGAVRLQALAAEVESSASTGASESIVSMVERLKTCYAEVSERLGSERARRLASIDPPPGAT